MKDPMFDDGEVGLEPTYKVPQGPTWIEFRAESPLLFIGPTNADGSKSDWMALYEKHGHAKMVAAYRAIVVASGGGRVFYDRFLAHLAGIQAKGKPAGSVNHFDAIMGLLSKRGPVAAKLCSLAAEAGRGGSSIEIADYCSRSDAILQRLRARNLIP